MRVKRFLTLLVGTVTSMIITAGVALGAPDPSALMNNWP